MNHHPQRQGHLHEHRLTAKATLLSGLAVLAPVSAFVVSPPKQLYQQNTRPSSSGQPSHFLSIVLNIYAPPGSGYFTEDDEVSLLPDTYEPMMEYPGTMRPGRTPENIPYQDLPFLGENDPDPVPWPHFQQVEWHHRWDPPHPHPTPMEDFIDQLGRWATPELEAEMRAGARRGVQEKKEAQEAERRGTIITDDEVDDEMVVNEAPVSLGDGIFGQLGSAADQAATAAAVDPKNQKPGGALFDDDDDDEDDQVVGKTRTRPGEDESGEVEDDDGGSLDDFLFDLGLDTGLDGGDGQDDDEAEAEDVGPKTVAKSLKDLDSSDDDDDESGAGGVGGMATASSGTIHVEEDEDELDFEEEEMGTGDGAAGAVPLDDFGGGDDSLDDVNVFDEGGFDFDDDFDDGGADMW